ncbi:MAG: hypothetical protein M3Y80_02965, partial [Verrucomicrobiota bacterium]|nr:hypothetical protein [Verrucomicrobiota bacterium]
MFRARTLNPLLSAIAFVAAASSAEAIGIQAAEQAAVDTQSLASAGPVEPADLPGNTVAVPIPEPQPSAPEPPLPTAEGEPERAEPAPAEYSATPRRFRYAISVEVRGVYDDNVNLSHGTNRRADFYTALMPQLTAGIGDVDERQENYIALNYAPSGFLYFGNSDFSTIEQVGRIEGQWRIRRVTLRLSQDLQSIQSSNLNVATPGGGFANQTALDVGGRRRITTYGTRLEASAELTGKSSLRIGADYVGTAPEGLIGSDVISGSLGLDYRYGPKLTAGFGVSAGETFVDAPSPDQT